MCIVYEKVRADELKREEKGGDFFSEAENYQSGFNGDPAVIVYPQIMLLLLGVTLMTVAFLYKSEETDYDNKYGKGKKK